MRAIGVLRASAADMANAVTNWARRSPLSPSQHPCSSLPERDSEGGRNAGRDVSGGNHDAAATSDSARRINFSTIGNTLLAGTRSPPSDEVTLRISSPFAPMNLSSTFKLASLALCAVLVGCQNTAEQAPPTAVRTRAPQGYEKAITNYLWRCGFAGRRRMPRSTSARPSRAGSCGSTASPIRVAAGSCPWSTPTRTGEPSGKETINIATRQYYFWPSAARSPASRRGSICARERR